MDFNYNSIINTVTFGAAYPLAAVFLFILVFGDGKNKVSSFVLILYFSSGLLLTELDIHDENYKQKWIEQCFILLQLSGVFFLTTVLAYFFDKNNKYYSFIFLSTVITHGMTVTHLEKTPLFLSSFTIFFYNYYDEIILFTYLLIIGVSYNGFITAYTNTSRGIQRFLYDFTIRNSRRCKLISKRKEAKEEV